MKNGLVDTSSGKYFLNITLVGLNIVKIEYLTPIYYLIYDMAI